MRTIAGIGLAALIATLVPQEASLAKPARKAQAPSAPTPSSSYVEPGVYPLSPRQSKSTNYLTVDQFIRGTQEGCITECQHVCVQANGHGLTGSETIFGIIDERERRVKRGIEVIVTPAMHLLDSRWDYVLVCGHVTLRKEEWSFFPHSRYRIDATGETGKRCAAELVCDTRGNHAPYHARGI